MKVALYCRVSTSDQDCEMQVRELKEYIARRNWEVYGEFVDSGWSGATSSRPQLDLLMKAARLRHFDTVICWSLDRWGRSMQHCIQSMTQLADLGVRFMALTQNIDTDDQSAAGKLMCNILMSFAEWEREMIRERVICGIANARAKGVKLGPKFRVFRRDEAIRLRASGVSWRNIAKELQVPVGTIRDACAAGCAVIASIESPSKGSNAGIEGAGA